MNNILFKKFIDIALLILFICELSGFLLPSNVHVILGYAFLLLLILHNIANINFYKTLFKGKYNLKRSLNTICVLLLGLSLIALAFSGIAISENIFTETNWRSIHLNTAILSLALLVIHVIIYSKRYIKGKAFYALTILSLLTAISSIFVIPYIERWYHKVNFSVSEAIKGEKIALNKKVLTIYFTRVGNTDFTPNIDAVSGASLIRDKSQLYGNSQVIAYMIQDAVGGEVEAISTEKKYLPSYMDTIKEAGKEFSDSKLPAIKENKYNPQDYDIIFIIYPLWWSTIPKAIESYIAKYNLSEKTIIPVVTHGGGSFIKSIEDLKSKVKAHYPDKYLDIYSSNIANSRQKIADYIKQLKILK